MKQNSSIKTAAPEAPSIDQRNERSICGETAFVRAVVAAFQEAIGPTITEITKISGRGISNQVLVLHSEQGRFVARCNVAEHGERFRREAWALEQAHLVGVPVPQVLLHGVLAEGSYSIAPFIEHSAPIQNHHDMLRVWRSLGRYSAQLQSIPITGFGEKMVTDGVFQDTWEQMLDRELGIIFRDDLFVEAGMATASQHERLKASLRECRHIAAPVGLCVFDLCAENAIIQNDDYDRIYLLDFEYCMAAPAPHYQLACIARGFGHDSEELKAFVTGLGLSTDDQADMAADLNRLIVLRYLRSARWSQDRKPELLQAHLDTAGKVMRDLLAL